MVEDVLFLFNLLQFDFVFIKPCDSLDSIVERVIRSFEEEDIILIDMVNISEIDYYFYLANCCKMLCIIL